MFFFSQRSIASSYDTVQRQSEQGTKNNELISDWIENGLEASNVKIINESDEQNQTWGKDGMLFRKYNAINNSFDDTQLKIINSTIAITDDNWKTTKVIESEFDNIKTEIDTIISDVETATTNADNATQSAIEVKATIEEALNNGDFKGADGISITNAQIIENDLIVSLSNGTEINAGKIRDSAKKYGICYDMKSRNPKLTRLGDARYMRAEISDGNDGTKVINDFDNVYPWCDIKRCTVTTDGTVTSYEGDPDYKEDGSMGEVQTIIPEHYEMKYVSEATGKMYYYVSREKLNEYYKYVPEMYIGSFFMTTNTDGSGESRAGATYYYNNYTYKNAQTAAKAKGNGWHMFDIWEYETIKTLFMIEFATLDSQSIYPGNTDIYAPEVYINPNEECAVDFFNETENVTDTEFTTNYFVTDNESYFVGDEVDIPVIRNDNPEEFDYESNGEFHAVRMITKIEPVDAEAYPDLEDLESLYYFSGTPITMEKIILTKLEFGRNGQLNRVRDKASSSKFPYYGDENLGFVYRGIENFLSMSYTFIDGMILYNGQYWICENPNDYQHSIYVLDEAGSATEELLYKPITSFNYPSNGYITKMGIDEETGLTLPVETTGTSDTAYCDWFTKPRTLTTQGAVRWNCTPALQSGLFCLSCIIPTSNSTSSKARLSYRHSQ